MTVNCSYRHPVILKDTELLVIMIFFLKWLKLVYKTYVLLCAVTPRLQCILTIKLDKICICVSHGTP